MIYGDVASGNGYTGYVQSYATTFNSAQGGVGAAAYDGSVATQTYAGQSYQGANYSVYEAFFRFITTELDGETPTSVVLALYQGTSYVYENYTIEARVKGTGGSLTTADFHLAYNLGNLPLRATFATSGRQAGYNDFTSDASFVNNLTSPVELVLCGLESRTGVAPTTYELFHFSLPSYSGTTQDPKLTVVTTTGGGQNEAPLIQAPRVAPVSPRELTGRERWAV